MSETLVGLAEAAALKGVHYQTVRRAIARGDLKAMKVGGGVIIIAADLDAWRPSYSHAPRQPRRGSRDESSIVTTADPGDEMAKGDDDATIGTRIDR